jgi:hypothetical protein
MGLYESYGCLLDFFTDPLHTAFVVVAVGPCLAAWDTFPTRSANLLSWAVRTDLTTADLTRTRTS